MHDVLPANAARLHEVRITLGARVCTAHSAYEPCRTHERRACQQVFVCELPSLPLVHGEYKMHVGLEVGSGVVDWVEDAGRLTVVDVDFYGTGVLPTRGVFLLNNRWTLDHVTGEVVS